MKEGKNPTWSKMQDVLCLLDDINKALSAKLLEAYFATNFVETVRRYWSGNSSTEEEDAKWKEVSDKIRFVVREVIYNLAYKSNEGETLSRVREIETIAPQAAWFYCYWLNGFTQVAKRNYKKGLELYREAFNHCHFAGDYIDIFLCQAITLSLHNDFNINTARKSIDPKENSVTPFPNFAKQCMNYGWTMGLFPKKANEAHIEAFGWGANFDRYFRKEMFIIANDKDFNMANKFQLNPEHISIEYSDLQSLTEIDVNKRRCSSLTNNGVKFHSIALAVFAASICFDRNYEQCALFIKLVDKWLADFKNIDFGVLSDKGNTIAADVILRYGTLRRQNFPQGDIRDFKRIAVEVIKRTEKDYLILSSATKGKNALLEAIKAFDYDLVKEIAEKVGDAEIKGLVFPQDECSPIDFCKKRMGVLRSGLPSFDINNINVNKMNIPGLTQEEKLSAFTKMLQSPRAYLSRKMTLEIEYGVPQVRDEQMKELNRIIEYLESL